jgi:rubrerythrin
MRDPIDSVEVFCAHALAMECEAALRYTELAESMEMQSNIVLAELFRSMAAEETAHAKIVARQAAGLRLPVLFAHEYRWQGFDSPEAAPHVSVHRRMQKAHGLRIALANEQRAAAYFEWVAERAMHPAVRNLAMEFAAEEQEHVGRMLEALSREIRASRDTIQDLGAIASRALRRSA